MRKLLYLLIAAALCVPVGAQAWWKSIQQVGVSAAPSYVGPGDVPGYSGAYAYWGLRCYNSAYSGNVAQVWDAATGTTTETLLTCSSGGTINETIHPLATTCASSCIVKVWYDQSGNGRDLSCVGFPSPNFVASGVGISKPSLFFQPGNGTFCSSAANATALAQPFTISGVDRNNVPGTNGGLFGDGGFGIQLINGSAAVSIYAGSATQTLTGVTDGQFGSIQAVYNGASSSTNAANAATNPSGTPTTVSATPGANGIGSTANKLTVGALTDAGAAGLSGYIFEVMIIPSAVSPTNQAAMVANQRAYGGF